MCLLDCRAVLCMAILMENIALFKAELRTAIYNKATYASFPLGYGSLGSDCMVVGLSGNEVPTYVLATWLFFKEPFTCPSPYTDDADIGMCYKVYTQNRAWGSARSYCQSEQADLVTLDTVAKLNYFKGFLPWGDYHIGAAKSGNDFTWLSTNSIIDTSLWGNGCPDNPNTELCVSLTTFTRLDLNDIHCSNYNFQFICEIRQS
ncbi:hypothetical protein EGW08_007780 [Elysia chlorotica]|uniref:C-type lectin domain-containing protein n=1 Tax=Elysia chlorotica TaxID=188477 RepID=A0A3S1HR24_ELYCH|nr:hypothetical protein EGW08_007780 [Elysia chlorotica]